MMRPQWQNFKVEMVISYKDMRGQVYYFNSLGESRQLWANFQFAFFFWQVDNEESKNKYSCIAVYLFCWIKISLFNFSKNLYV